MSVDALLKGKREALGEVCRRFGVRRYEQSILLRSAVERQFQIILGPSARLLHGKQGKEVQA